MPFEFDPGKSASNKVKHGIDFVDAQALWSDPLLLVAPARTSDEVRYVAVGLIRERHWTAVFTLRETVVRIISVRRARREEIDRYES